MIGMIATALLFNMIGSETKPMFGLFTQLALCSGGFAFGMIFIQTPCLLLMTNTGKWFFGALIGVMVVLIRG